MISFCMFKGFDVNVKTERDRYDLPSESGVGKVCLIVISQILTVGFEKVFHRPIGKSRSWDENTF